MFRFAATRRSAPPSQASGSDLPPPEFHLDLAHPALTGDASPKDIATGATPFAQSMEKTMDEDTDTKTVSLGRVVATPGALKALEKSGESFLPYLARHAGRDYGEISPEDWEENEFSVL